jgi:hypothetical protein
MHALDQLTGPRGSTLQSQATPVMPARVKVLNPLLSMGPSMHAELLGFSEGVLKLRVPQHVLVGSTVQVRTPGRVAFGEVRSSMPAGEQDEIEVTVQRSA